MLEAVDRRSEPALASGLALVVALVLLPPAAGAPARPGDGKLAHLTAEQREWLEDVELIITKEERSAFLELGKDYQREAFIRRFWESRDPTPATERNEFKDRHYSRLRDARLEFKYPQDDRRKIYVFHGDPGDIMETDCGALLWPLQIWRYGYAELVGGPLVVIFTQRNGGGPYRIWRPNEGYRQLFALGGSNYQDEFYAVIAQYCTELYDVVQELMSNLRRYEVENRQGPVHAERAPPASDPEWLDTFHAFSTDATASATPLNAEIAWQFRGRRGLRTVVEGALTVPVSESARTEIGGRESFNFLLTGEVLREAELFESFRYRFDLPVRADPDPSVLLVFERYLRPGSYQVVLKLEDLNGTGELRRQVGLEVPWTGDPGPAEEALDATGPEPAADAPASIELIAQEVDLKSGLHRFLAKVSGARVSKVRFLLDDRPILTKTRPPYSVELDLGRLPVTRRVRVLALDAAGAELATDEVLLNAGEHTFVVRLVEPRQGERYRGQVRARAEVQAPAGRRVDRVEFYLGEARVATLFQPPYVQPIELADDSLTFVRAVAFLEDDNSSEDLVVFNSSQYLEDISVKVVELFATVIDERGRPIEDLTGEAFTVVDDGEEQTILRFEQLDDLPIYAGLLLDTSASMAASLEEVRRVALGFLEQTMTPRDRACVITFSDTPRLAAEFTNEVPRLAGGLAGLTAERSTALYDSVMFGLYYFRGIKGQRALIVLSDGQDRKSEATFEQVLDFARSSGVTIYTIGFKLGKGGRVSRSRLSSLAVETGGQGFFVESTSELEGIYAAIQRDLRSRYLLVYQPAIAAGGGFRKVEVRVAVPGAEVRTMNGYIP